MREVEGEREGVVLEDQGREGVGSVVQHLLGEPLANDDGLGPKVEEHGVGLPAPDEFDGVLVDARAE